MEDSVKGEPVNFSSNGHWYLTQVATYYSLFLEGMGIYTSMCKPRILPLP